MPQLFPVLHGLWYCRFARADLHSARTIAEQLVDVANARRDGGLELAARRSLGYTLLFLGELRDADWNFEWVTSAYDVAVHGNYASRYGGADPGSGSLSNRAWGLGVLGLPDQAVGLYQQGLARAQELDHPFSEAYASITAAVVHQFRREPREALSHAEAAATIATDRGFNLFIEWARILRGWALVEQGGGTEALALVCEGIEASRSTGANLLAPYWLSLLACAHGRLGQPAAGLAVTDEALGEVARSGERLWEAELHRLKGELLLASDAANKSEAEACFLSAIEIAQAQEARTWELRAATSLARLWQQQDKRGEAHDLLESVFAWFTEGLDTADLRDARALLGEAETTGSHAVPVE